MNFLVLLMPLLGTFTYLLNFFNKIAECSLIFVFLALTANVISELYSKKSALIGLVVSVVISFSLLWNFDYYIHGLVIPGVVLSSFISVLVSISCSTSIFLYLKPISFNARNFVSLFIAAIIDGIIMSSYFITQFASSRVFYIFSKEVLFKCLYSGIIYGLFFVGSYLIRKSRARSKIMN